MIRHCVIFDLKLSGNAKEQEIHLQEVKKRLEHLPETIDGLESLDVYFNCNPAETSTFMLQADVESLEAVRFYATHPDHVAIVNEWIAPYKVGRSCIDYELHESYPH